MSAINQTGQHGPVLRSRRASIAWLLAAACLFLASAALQVLASLQRWVVFGGSRAPEDLSDEDHRYDYSFPVDPWEPVGSAAQLFGAGTLVLALGVLAMALGLRLLPGDPAPRGAGAVESVVAVIVAASFGLAGTHALLSGISGAPSPLQHTGQLELLGFAGLITLGVLWRGRLPAAMAACLFLLGSGGLGNYVAAFTIAPVFVGYISHDTTPWTETVVAMSPVAAGTALVVAAVSVARRGTASP